MSNSRYTEEFKIEAVKQVADRGHSVAEVAARLGVLGHSGSSATPSPRSIGSRTMSLRPRSVD